MAIHSPSFNAAGCIEWPYTARHLTLLAAAAVPSDSNKKAAGCLNAMVEGRSLEKSREGVEVTQLVSGLPELDRLSQDDLVEFSLDFPTAVTTVFGALPQLAAHPDRIAKEIPGFDIARFDKLEDCTMALSYASTVHATASRPADGLAELNESGTELRGPLQGDILLLISRWLINPTTIMNYAGLAGYKNVASDSQIQG
jgi:hypothetical protein